MNKPSTNDQRNNPQRHAQVVEEAEERVEGCDEPETWVIV
jgi:hypothetical protein